MVSTVDGGGSAPGELPDDRPSRTEIELLSKGLELVAARRLSDSENVRDAVQETLTRTLEAIREGRIPAGVSVAAFAYGIHRHVVADVLRARYRGRALPLPGTLVSPDPSPLERLITSEEKRAVTRALERLPASDREILRQCFVEGRKTAEIAGALEVPAARIRKRKSRALEKLREILTGPTAATSGHDPTAPTTTET